MQPQETRWIVCIGLFHCTMVHWCIFLDVLQAMAQPVESPGNQRFSNLPTPRSNQMHQLQSQNFYIKWFLLSLPLVIYISWTVQKHQEKLYHTISKNMVHLTHIRLWRSKYLCILGQGGGRTLLSLAESHCIIGTEQRSPYPCLNWFRIFWPSNDLILLKSTIQVYLYDML